MAFGSNTTNSTQIQARGMYGVDFKNANSHRITTNTASVIMNL